MACVFGDEGWHGLAQYMKRAREVDSAHLLDGLCVPALGFHWVIVACEIDHTIKRANRRCGGNNGGLIRYIKWRDTGVGYFGRKSGEFVLGAGGEHKVRSLCRELQSQGFAKAFARPNEPVCLARNVHLTGRIVAISSATLMPNLRISERLRILPFSMR